MVVPWGVWSLKEEEWREGKGQKDGSESKERDVE